jgi:hypothetical protein
VTFEEELAQITLDRYRAWAERQPPALTFADFLDEQHARLRRLYPDAYSPDDREAPAAPPDDVH